MSHKRVRSKQGAMEKLYEDHFCSFLLIEKEEEEEEERRGRQKVRELCPCLVDTNI